MENSSQWIDGFFVERGELFLQILNRMWLQSEPIVDGIVELARALAKLSGLLVIYTVNRDAFIESSLYRLKVYDEYGRLVVLEEPTLDYSASRASMKWRFYSKDGNNLKYMDTVEYDVRQYSFYELVRILSKAGWTMLGAYGHVCTLQTFTQKSSRIVVVACAL